MALLVLPGFDHRLGWSTMPLAGVIAGDALVAIGFYFIFLVYRENTFTSAIIEVAENQKVISTGPYAIVRHPMYAGASLYLLGTPLALASYWGFASVAAMMPFLIWRLIDEERFRQPSAWLYRIPEAGSVSPCPIRLVVESGELRHAHELAASSRVAPTANLERWL